MAVAVFSSCQRGNNLPSLRETFSAKDKIPFGTYVAHKLLGQLFYDNTVRDKKQHFAVTWNEISDTGSLYVCISKNLFLSAEDRQSMLNYADSGNSLFIACENIDSAFLKALNCDINVSPIGINGFYRLFDYTNVAMNPASYNDFDKYGYYYFRSENTFAIYDSSTTKILGLNDTGMPDFIVIFYGKGRIYLHCEPRVFGNYFLLQKGNYHYLQNVFAFMPQAPEHVFWDDYYNNHNRVYRDSDNGRLSVLFQYPPMAWAFWLLILMLVLYVLFGSKRRQRIIKVILPNANTTVAFAETIGRLYYQEKNNKNIADKIITYFMERIRNQYFINTSQLNDVFITTLSRKSSVSKDQVAVLFSTIASVQQSEKISDQQLLLLNRQIENFYKNKT
jgi:hypothetical protein